MAYVSLHTLTHAESVLRPTTTKWIRRHVCNLHMEETRCHPTQATWKAHGNRDMKMLHTAIEACIIILTTRKAREEETTKESGTAEDGGSTRTRIRHDTRRETTEPQLPASLWRSDIDYAQLKHVQQTCNTYLCTTERRRFQESRHEIRTSQRTEANQKHCRGEVRRPRRERAECEDGREQRRDFETYCEGR